MLIFFISAVVGLMALVYLLLPALTFTDLTGWFLVFCVLGCLTIGLGMGEKGTAAKVTAFVLAASMVLVVGAGIVFSPFIMSRNYAGVLGGLEKTDIEEYTPSIDTVPLMDQDTAELLMNRTLGTLVDEVSQFELGDSTQINYQGRAVRVAPLKYAGFFKYMNNRQSGIPAYVTVDMQTQKTEIHYLEQGSILPAPISARTCCVISGSAIPRPSSATISALSWMRRGILCGSFPGWFTR